MLEKLYSRIKIPKWTESDNMSFNIYKFKQFAEKWGLEVITSNFNYPKSKGLSKKGMQIAKITLAKSQYTNLNLQLYLYYENSPITGVGYILIELQSNRKLKIKLKRVYEIKIKNSDS